MQTEIATKYAMLCIEQPTMFTPHYRSCKQLVLVRSQDLVTREISLAFENEMFT